MKIEIGTAAVSKQASNKIGKKTKTLLHSDRKIDPSQKYLVAV